LAMLALCLIPPYALQPVQLHAHSHRVRARSPRAAATASYEISKAKGNEKELSEAAAFFVESFWKAGTTTDALELSGLERKQLVQQQTADMEARYGDLVGARRLQSSLFVARDADGAIGGIVGVEAAMVDMVEQQVLTRAAGEALFANEFASMGARERSIYRKMPLDELCEELLPEYKIFGLLANLAVAPSSRRTGLARQLCERCDEATAGWDLPAISLQVEECNAAARGLYEAVGYTEIFRDEKNAALRLNPDSDELLTTVPSPLITMAKGV